MHEQTEGNALAVIIRAVVAVGGVVVDVVLPPWHTWLLRLKHARMIGLLRGRMLAGRKERRKDY
jgi:hypothetical protein